MDDDKKTADPKLLEAVRLERASWTQDGGGVRGFNSRITVAGTPGPEAMSATRWPSATDLIRSHVDETPFPLPTTTDVTTTAQESPAAAAENEYSFRITLKEINQMDGTVDVFIDYGEIDGDPPEDMTSDTEFVFTLDTAGSEIYAEIGYDEHTLEIDSRTLEFADVVPDSELGILRVPIGFVDWEINMDSGLIENVICHNRECEDINPQFFTGAVNGAPSIFPIKKYGDPVATED